MNNLQPMFMEPIFKETVWGGEKIRTVFGKEIPSEHTGESWEAAAHANGHSKIRDGFMAGKTLQEAVLEAPEMIMGTEVMEKFGTHFPLLIKIIDANDNLSVQVHPNDEMAHLLEGPHEDGKTEMWVVLEAKPGAKLIYGFKEDITEEQFAAAIEEQKLEELVNWISVKKGDTFFIPAGMLHAIGAGILIAEIQQNSDTTYRVYDFGRLGLDGKTRELHTEKAQKVTNLSSSLGKELADIDAGVCCEYFKTYRRVLQGRTEIEVEPAHFQIIMVLEGSGNVNGMPLKMGDTILLPAAMGKAVLEGEGVYLQVM